MTTATEIAETVQDGILKAIETSQRLTLEAFSAFASTVDGMVPERPVLPFATAFATPQEAIDTGFRFAERLLVSQKSFFSQVAAIAMPAEAAVPAPKKPAA